MKAKEFYQENINSVIFSSKSTSNIFKKE